MALKKGHFASCLDRSTSRRVLLHQDRSRFGQFLGSSGCCAVVGSLKDSTVGIKRGFSGFVGFEDPPRGHG
jgi:hypothetical protein